MVINGKRRKIISIHSPRMGRDNGKEVETRKALISIHSPRMGRDAKAMCFRVMVIKFQSTLPAWGETCEHLRRRSPGGDFNPLSPHGERRL